MLPAGRDQQPFGARGEQPLGAGVVLLRPVVGDPQDQPGPRPRGGLVGAADHLGEVVRRGGREHAEDQAAARAAGPGGDGVLRPGHRAVDPVEQAAVGQFLDVPAHRDGRDPQLRGQVRHPGGAPVPHQPEQAVMTFSSTLAHGGSPLAVCGPARGPAGTGAGVRP